MYIVRSVGVGAGIVIPMSSSTTRDGGGGGGGGGDSRTARHRNIKSPLPQLYGEL